MTKSVIWNQLKEVGFDSKQLKAVYDVSYQQASLELLQTILEQLQKEVVQGVNENLGVVSGEVTGNEINLTETELQCTVGGNTEIKEVSEEPVSFKFIGGTQSIKMLTSEIQLTDLDSLINQLQQIRNSM